jgi:hypothetical protein
LSLTVLFFLNLVFLPWGEFMLFSKLFAGTVVSTSQVSGLVSQVSRDGQRSQAKPVLVHDVLKADAFDSQLVRQLGISAGWHALHLFHSRQFLR